MSDRKRKPIYRRFWVWLVAAVVVGAVIAGGSGSEDDAEAPASGSSSAQTDSDSAEEPAPAVGETVPVGDIEWTIAEAETAEALEGDFETVTPGSERTILVRVAGEVVNTSNKEVSTLGNFVLVDGTGNEYGEHEDAAWVADPLVLDTFNPNVPKSFSTVFEVPRDVVDSLGFKATGLQMFSSDAEIIDLNLGSMEEAHRRCTDQDVAGAHRHTIFNAQEIHAGWTCVCFYCGHRFPSAELNTDDWTDLNNPKGPTTLCPQCGIDAVISDASGFPVVDAHFEARCTRAWFNGYSRMENPDSVPPRAHQNGLR